MAFTSESHPIRLDPIGQSPTGGILYLTFAPGKTQSRSYSNSRGWNRNLDVDLERMKTVYNISGIVCLLEPHEIAKIGPGYYPDKAKTYGFEYKNYPIVDMNIPSGMPENFPMFHQFIQGIISDLSQGKNIAVHCMGGLGRAGTIGSCILVCEGYQPDDSIRWIQSQRPNTIKRASQKQFVRDYSNYLTRINH